MRFLIFLFFITLIYSNPLSAQEAEKTLELNGKQILLPEIKGFVEVSDLTPELRNLFQQFVPPQNRLLAVFITEQDYFLLQNEQEPTFSEYAMIQTAKVDPRATKSDFIKVKNLAKEQFQQYLDKSLPDINQIASSASKYIQELTDKSLKMEVGEIRYLGVFHETDEALSSLILGNYGMAIDEQQENYTTAGSISFLRVKGNVVYLYVYKEFSNSDDLNWVKSKSMEVTKNILASNPSTTRDQFDEVAYTTSSSKIVRSLSGIMGAILVGLIVFISGLGLRKVKSIILRRRKC